MNIFAVGDLNPDIFVYSEKIPKRGIEQRADLISYSIGGNAANFAMALSGLGLKTTLISMKGKDCFSSFLIDELRRAGVKPHLIDSEKPNAVSVIFVSKDGERAIMSSKAALLDMNCYDVSKILMPKLKKGDLVFFGGFFHLPKMKNGFSSLLSEIKKKGAFVFLDLCYDEYNKWKLPALGLIDVLFLNEIELKMFSGTADKKKAIEKLFSQGAKKIVLKEGSKGSELFSFGNCMRLPALSVKAINTTAAGDFFNAGYVYAFSKGYGDKTCLSSGNFVAAKKISREGYYLPSGKSLESYLSRQNLLCLRKFKDYSSLSKAIAEEVVAQLRKKPDSTFSLAAGSTPLGAYKELARLFAQGKADFSKAFFVELDEYCGAKEKSLLAHSLKKSLLGKLNFKNENILLFNSNAKNRKKECARFERFIKRRGIDFILLGIGKNCHIAFNEPGTSFSSKVHVAKLKHEAPSSYAFTLGIADILSAGRIILAASGNSKAKAVRKTFFSEISNAIPSTALRKHKNAEVFADFAAASLV